MANKKTGNDYSSKLTTSDNRLIYVEPNCSDREIPSLENFSILVNLKSISKSRSTLIEGNVTNTEGSSTEIGFIDGTNIGGGRRSLTTNYTEIGTDFTQGGENDLETLGIESIDISFDTAYTPMIKIKFIDIRGNAVLSKGNKSRYKMFFDLPFPIFELTVKGFYGKAVTYCLHLTKWNASFNSSTGNFEIDTEFIGYTYALLTDCLLGYMRATVYTDIGERIFNKYKSAYPQLLPMEEFLDYVQKINDEFGKVKEKDPNIKQINALTVLGDKIGKLEDRLDDLKEISISGLKSKRDLLSNNSKNLTLLNVNDHYNDNNGTKIKINKKIVTYIDVQKREVESINKKIEVPALKIKSDEITKLKYIYITYKNETLTFNTPTNYTPTEEDKIKKLILNQADTLTGEKKLILFDLTAPYDEIERITNEIRKTKKELETNLTELLKQKVSQLSFKPTIRNIINMLCIHAQVFLETIREVSKNAEKQTNSARIEAIKATRGFKKNNIKSIYAWPEYNTKVKGQIVESWIGSDLAPKDYRNVNEVMFVEELLSNLISVAKKDDIRKLIGSTESVGFFPVSPTEANISINGEDSLIKNNPYYEALKSPSSTGVPQEAIRCLLLRTFVALGVTNRFTGPRQRKVIGFLEADNLMNVLNSEFDTIERTDFIRVIRDLASSGFEAGAEAILKEWRGKPGGVDGLKHPPNNPKARMYVKDRTDNYKYTYIQSKENTRYKVSYIPINGGFDGNGFFNSDGKGKTFSELKTLSETLIFTSDYYCEVANNSSMPVNDDGALLFKILIDDDGNELESKSNLANSTALAKYKSEVENFQAEDVKFKYFNSDDLLGLIYTDHQLNSPTVTPVVVAPTPEEKALDMYNSKFKTLEIDEYVDVDSEITQVAAAYFAISGHHGLLRRKTDLDSGSKASSLPKKATNGLEFKIPYREITKDNPYPYNKNIWNGGNKIIVTLTKEENKIFRNQLTINTNKPNNFVCIYTETIQEGDLGWNSNRRLKDLTLWNGKNSSNLPTTGALITSRGHGNSTEVSPNPKFIAHDYDLIQDVIANGGNEIIPLSVPFVDISVYQNVNLVNNSSINRFIEPQRFSLFGSGLYYSQLTSEAKAFLFLHSISWSGVVGNVRDTNTKYTTAYDDIVSLFEKYRKFGAGSFPWNKKRGSHVLSGLYSTSGSFIKAPKLWCAFIGALLTRYDEGENGNTNWLVPSGTGSLPWWNNSYFPKHDEYLRFNSSKQGSFGITFVAGIKSNPKSMNYARVDDNILNLPKQVREEFKKAFKLFVKNDFIEIQKNYELFKDEDDRKDKYDILKQKVHYGYFKKNGEQFIFNQALSYTKYVNLKKRTVYVYPDQSLDFDKERERKFGWNKYTKVIKTSEYISAFKKDIYGSETNSKGGRYEDVLKNYRNISPVSDKRNWASGTPIKQFDLTLMDNDNNDNLLVKLFLKEYTIMNATPKIFSDPSLTDQGPSVPKYMFKNVLARFFERFLDLTKDLKNDDDNIKQRIFNNVDDDIIKLNIYRTLSAINDKWLGSDTNRACSNIEDIVNSFRFLDSGFLEIGDDFLINPLTVQQKIVNNYNQSFFDLVNSILIENNFNFIALPSFIDFTNAEDMRRDIFTPYAWSEKISKESTGASFVCVYTGQKSSNLNLGDDEEHEDDGFSVLTDGKCDNENGSNLGPIPEVFQNSKEQKGYNIPYFLVSYGKGNQSIFKDIKLDQREFTETAESLEIIDDISDTGNKNKATYKGQNLFNVYQKRAYSAEVEMMGNVTIQPMMYFQLNNIPMFKGAYLIYKTTHSITAHNMKTTFKGSRIKKVKTPLITESQLFKSLIGSISDGGTDEKIKKVSATTPTFSGNITSTFKKSKFIKIS